MIGNFARTSRTRRKGARGVSIAMAVMALLIAAMPTFATEAKTETDSGSKDQPNAACPADGQCFADVPPTSLFFSFVNRIYQQDLVSGYPCGGLGEPCDSAQRPYYRPVNGVTRQQMSKFIDNARHDPGIDIEGSSGALTPIFVRNDTGTAFAAHSTNGQAVVALSVNDSALYAQSGNTAAVYGFSTGGSNGAGVRGDGTTGVKGNSSDSNGYGVYGTNSSGVAIRGEGLTGVRGVTTSIFGYGVYGSNNSGTGVYGVSDSGNGVEGYSTSVTGVYGASNGGNGVRGYSYGGDAGYFVGNVEVTGNLSKGGGSFKIDDPLDPANKYLYHSFVESPDMMDIYNGNVTTDANGDATITMPNWFQPLNRDFRYQLTPIGEFAQAMVSREIQDNRFSIKTDKPNVKVSWQVTGIRQDPYANAHRIPVEQDKPANEKGKYLYPIEYGQPASSGLDYETRHPGKASSKTP